MGILNRIKSACEKQFLHFGVPYSRMKKCKKNGFCKTLFFIYDNIGDLVPPVAVFWYR